MQVARWMQGVGFLFVAGAAVGIALSFGVYEIADTTDSAKFCGSCHVMEPFVASFQIELHGGNNQVGFSAKCNDCHLPHDNVLNYLFVKAITGANDVWVNTFRDTSKIDWIQKMKDPGRYVYDSGCMTCHVNLQAKSLSNPRAFLPHRAYFARTAAKTCADCHSDVGHEHLAEFVKK